MMPTITPAAVEPARTAQDGNSASASGEAVDSFAATVEQLLQATPSASTPVLPPPPVLELESVDLELGDDGVLATPIDAIDWLIGQCVEPLTQAAQSDTAPSISCSLPDPSYFGGMGPGAMGLQALPTRGPAVPGDVSGVEPGGDRGLGAPQRLAPGDAQDMRATLSSSLLEDVLRTSGNGQNDEGDAQSPISMDTGTSAAQAAPPQTSAPALRAEVAPRVVTAALHTPVGTPAWNDELATKLTWLIDRGEQLASIRVTPDSLGPIDIRIAVREGEASIWFGANQSDTRQAIEQAIPRLREMLASQGLSLTDAGVFQQAPRDPQRALLRNDLQRAARESGDGSASQVTALRLPRGLIDDYA